MSMRKDVWGGMCRHVLTHTCLRARYYTHVLTRASLHTRAYTRELLHKCRHELPTRELPDTRYQTLDTQHELHYTSDHARATTHVLPNTCYQILDTKHVLPRIGDHANCYQQLATKHWLPHTCYHGRASTHLLPNTCRSSSGQSRRLQFARSRCKMRQWQDSSSSSWSMSRAWR